MSEKNQLPKDKYGRDLFPIVCNKCGKPSMVPFEPEGVRPVYCSDCYTGGKYFSFIDIEE